MQEVIEKAIREASKIVSYYWPLHSFITVNPLWQLTDQSFCDAINQINERSATMPHQFYLNQYEKGTIDDESLAQAIRFHLPSNSDDLNTLKPHLFSQSLEENASKKILFAQQIDEYHYYKPLTWIQEQCNHWLLQFFGRAVKKRTNYEQSLETFWKGYVINEHQSLESHFNQTNNTIALISRMITEMAIPSHNLTAYFKEIFLQQYGWSSLINWINARPNNPWLKTNTKLETILLMWVSYEWLIFKDKNQPYTPETTSEKSAIPILSIWQSAYEYKLHNELINKLDIDSDKPWSDDANFETQWVFCIDTRSEGIRRHIEATANHTTYGFAGFFGFAFQFEDEKHEKWYQSPAILDPEQIVRIQKQNLSLKSALKKHYALAINDSKNHLSAPFALFELFGIFKLAKLIKSTFFNKNALSINHQAEYDVSEIDDETAANAGYNFLSTIGLTRGFASEVILCGHQSINDNNPYAATLDCGACGGNSGIPNVIIASKLLNQRGVRNNLSKMGIVIPDETLFYPACHFTTYDRIVFLADKPSEQTVKVANQATSQLRKEKVKDTVYQENANMLRKENDWSDLIPETGLANNYALIIGPRRLNKHINLQRSVFLHSYEPREDPDGQILAGIIAAPVIVAHWINSQYYFSTVNQKQFGAGNKAIHNVIPGIGVMEGNLSDLKVGLPQQSVFYRDTMIHEPRKLLVIIYGNKSVIHNVIEQNQQVNQLISGGWLTLKIIEST